jgi:hypothetical protein
MPYLSEFDQGQMAALDVFAQSWAWSIDAGTFLFSSREFLWSVARPAGH